MAMKQLHKSMERIQLGIGCPNNCWFCKEPEEIKYNGIPEFKKDKLYITDMNILAYPDHYKIINDLGKTKKYIELSSGIDWRRLDIPTACLLRKYRFGRFNKTTGKWTRYIRIAWDGSERLQYKILDAVNLLLTAGFKPNQIGVFMLVNGKISFEECCRKLDTIKYWHTQVLDCCYDGGYPDSEEDYNLNLRFEGKQYWQYKDIVIFRDLCRKHDQKVKRHGTDPEIKCLPKNQTQLIEE